VSDVNFADGCTRIVVSRGWDEKHGEIPTKNRRARRVPVGAILRPYLVQHKLATGRDGDDFLFGSTASHPFTPTAVRKRALRAWENANSEREAQRLPRLEPIGLHECRHTFVTLMFEAGMPLEAIGDLVGHSSTQMTERYRHLLDGHEDRAAALLDKYLAASAPSELGQVVSLR
jgi:integrase